MDVSRLLLFLLFALALQPARAELYKWVDSKGKVHYSDKKPEDRKAKSRAQRLELKTRGRQKEQMIGGSNAIIRPADREPRKLLVAEAIYNWEKRPASGQKSGKRKIGRYATGPGCNSRGPIRLPEVYLHHKDFFPSEQEIASSVARVIESLDYDADPVTRYRLIQRLKQTGGLSLHPVITDLDLTACARRSRGANRVPNPRDLSASSFDRNRVRITLLWKLKDDRDQRLLQEVTTKGYYSDPKSSISVSWAITRAIEAATAELMSRPDFVARLLVEEDGPGADGSPGKTAIDEPEPIPRKPDQPAHSLLLDLDLESWRQRQAAKPAGYLLFGARCSARRPVTVDDLELLPDLRKLPDTRMTDAVLKTGLGLQYSLIPPLNTARQRLQSNGGLLLKGELVEFSFDSCAPEQPASAKYKQVDRRSFRTLLRHRVRLGIKWSLRSGDGKHLLIQIRTRGEAGDLDSDNDLHAQLIAAMTQATRQLFAQPAFIDKLKIRQPRQARDGSFEVRRKAYRPLQPRPRDPARGQDQPLLLSLDDSPWKKLPAGKPIGMLAWGAGCRPLRTRLWPEDFNRYKALYPKLVELAAAEARALKSLDYPFVQTSSTDKLRLKRKLGGLLLEGEIQGLAFDSCAPKLDNKQLGRTPAPHELTRHRALLEVRWRLYGRDDAHPLLVTRSLGLADSWQINSAPRQILNQAMEDATRRLFAQDRFLLLLQQEGKTGKDKARGFFSRLFSGSDEEEKPDANRYIVQARLGKVLAELQNLRFEMIQYRELNGHWPNRFDEIGANPGVLRENPAIDDISLQPDGTILVELPANMGHNRLLQYGPVADDRQPARRDHWVCRSNLPEDYRPEPCQGL